MKIINAITDISKDNFGCSTGKTDGENRFSESINELEMLQLTLSLRLLHS